MVHNAKMVVEKFDRGITIRWNDTENNEQSSKTLAVNGQEAIALGGEIWKDIQSILDSTNNDKVIVTVNYDLTF